MQKLALVIVACVLLAAAPRAHQSVSTLKPADPAPVFSLSGADGKTYALADYKDKFLVLAWFRKAMSTGDTAECHSLMASADQLKSFDVTLLMLSVDTPELSKQFVDRDTLGFPVLSDADKTIATAYGVLAANNTANRWTFYVGPDGKFLKIDTRVNTLTAGPDMVKILTDLKVPKKK